MNGARLSAIEAFLAVADTGGFGEAARELGLSQSTVSRRIAQLEDHLGQRLLARSTRHVSMTETGQVFAGEARTAIAALRRAETRITGNDATLSGLVRITMPTAYGRLVVIPVIARLISEHPQLRFHLNLSDRYVDLQADGYDIAIRLNDDVPSGWKVDRLGSVGGGLFAAPAYLRQMGSPSSLTELARHRLLAVRTYTPRTSWKLTLGGREHAVEIAPAIVASDFNALHDLVVAGAGIAALPDYLSAQSLADGALLAVFPGAMAERWSVFAAYPMHLASDRRARRIVGALTAA